MYKYKEVGKRILGMVMAVCLVLGLIPPVPVRAATDIAATTITLYRDPEMTEEVDESTYTYSGNKIEPYVKVEYNGQTVERAGNYSVEYGENINAGTGTVTVMGGGLDYNGETTVNFTIRRKSVSEIKADFAMVDDDGVPYCYYTSASDGAKPEIRSVSVVEMNGTTVPLSSTDYTISYYDNKTACSDLNGGTPPRLMIALSNTCNYMTIGNAAKNQYFKIFYNMASVAVSGIPDPMVFNGTAQNPALTLTNTETGQEVAASNYTSRWSNNTNVGNATLTITGKGLYKGTFTQTYPIGQKDLNSADVTVETDQNIYEYRGGERIPIENNLIVKIGDYTVPSTNYTVTDQINGPRGTNRVKVIGQGNLKGEKNVSFLVKSAITSCEPDKREYSYTGAEIEPLLTVKDNLGESVAFTNYDVSYYDDKDYTTMHTGAPVAVGTYYIRLEAKGDSYMGTLGTPEAPIAFSIVPRDFGSVRFMLGGRQITSSDDRGDYYNGASIFDTLEGLTAEDNGKELLKSEDGDYTVSYYSDSACTREIEPKTDNFRNVGYYYIKMTGHGTYEGAEYVVHYKILPQDVTNRVSVTIKPQTYTGSAVIPDKSDIEIKVTINGREQVLPDSDYEIVTGQNNVNIGTGARLIIQLTGNYTTTEKTTIGGKVWDSTVTATFRIAPKKLSDCEKEIVDHVVYNGQVQKPSIAIRDGNYTLVENQDYSVEIYSSKSYQSNQIVNNPRNVGTYYVKVVGINAYENDAADAPIYFDFSITKKPLTASDITFEAANHEYTGSAVTPGLTVMDNGNVLSLGSDYEVVGYYSDENCTNESAPVAGKAYVKIRGIGNYDAEKVAVFFIGEDFAEAAGGMEVTGGSLEYNRQSHYAELNDRIVVYDKAGEPIAKDNYTLHYYTSPDYKTEITAEGNALFINAGTIYVRAEGARGYYGNFTGTCTIQKKSIEGMTAEVFGTFVYTGNAIELAIVQDASSQGIRLSDQTYTLKATEVEIRANSYVNNRSAGTASVTLDGKGNYTGSKTVNFTIQQRSLNSLSNLRVSVPEATYTSQRQTPTVTVTFGDANIALTEGTDFSLDYFTDASYGGAAADENLTDAGRVYVRITGIGNYKDVLDMNNAAGTNVFVINPRDITATNVDIAGLRFTYSAVPTNSKIPEYNVRYEYTPGSNFELEKNRDYICTQEQSGTTIPYKIGAQQIDIVGQGNFKGRKTITYYYLGNMDNAAKEIEVRGIEESYAYKANTAITCSNLSVWIAGGNVLSPSCYTVEYENNKTAGLATVKIIGNTASYWTGTYVQTFKITGSIADAEITIPDQIYTGTAYTADTLQDLKVVCDGMTLTRGVDYQVKEMKNATDAALSTDGARAPSITITGDGEYFAGTAEKTQTFSIKYDITSENLQVSEIADRIYTGSAIEPEVTVNYVTNTVTGAIATLKEGRDYSLTYRNNIEVASANDARGPHVVITALENGLLTSGYVIAPFTIKKVNIEEEEYGFHITGLEPEYMYTGRDIRPAIQIENADGDVLDAKNYKVSYSMNTAKPMAGTIVTVKAEGQGNYYGTLTATFQIIKRDISTRLDNVSASIEDQTYSGMRLTPVFRVTFEDYDGKTQTMTQGVDYEIVGYYNNMDAAEAGDESYGVHGYENGPYVQIKAKTGTSIEGTRNIPFTILPKDMDTLYYEPVKNPVYETGQEKYDPEVVVKIFSNSAEALREGIDYNITYENDTEVAESNGVNGPHIIVEPAMNNQNLTGSHMIEYSILPKSINTESMDVLLSDDDPANRFDSEKLNYPSMGTYYPNVVVRDNLTQGYINLTPDIDYTVTYVDNNKVGTASVVVTARGNYTGQRVVEFTIGTLFDREHVTVCAGNSSITEVPSVIYNGTSQIPTDLSVKANDTAELLTEGVDYTISYYLDEACKYAVLPDNIVNAGTYYVSVNGLTSAGYIGSIVLPYTIRQKSLNAADVIPDPIEDQKFAGGNVRPAVTLRDEETGLVIPAVAYDVTYRDNNSIGAAYAIVTANENGNYTGQREIGFRIVEQEIEAATIYAIPDYNYTGEEIKPSPAIYFNGTRLEEGTDYVLTYGNNVNAGKAWIIIQGRGNYKSVKEISFRIRASLEDAVVSEVPNQAYTGEEVRPTVTVSCGGNKLVAGEDYVITYSNNIEVGDAAIIISPSEVNPYYTSSNVVEFEICNSVASAIVTGIPSSQTYTGALILPEPQLYLGGKKLVKGKDYTVKWNNAVNVGNASVVITGMGETKSQEGGVLRAAGNNSGEYVGTRTIVYRIIPKSIARCTVSNIADVVYDGMSHAPAIVVRDGSKVLAEGTDYTVSYTGNINIGTGFAIVTGIGNYSGTSVQKFSVISAPITGLRTTSVKATSVKLSWTKKNNVTGYEVYTNNSRKRIAQTKKTSVTIKNLKAGKTYTYKVRTYTKIGTRTYFGDFVKITFATKPKSPSVTVSSSAKKTVKLSWNKISGASGYEIYASTTKKGSYKKVAIILKGSVVNYTNKGLSSGKTYYYKVRAYRNVGNGKVYSNYSAAQSVKVR